jgi:D-alanyl-lipoteichoic acid acyltransferase DltB (MBOAT superfamily)
MSFNSLEFIVFFTVVCTVYFSMPHRFRWVLLLGASYYFYASWNAVYLVLILASTAIDYSAGLLMSRTQDKRKRLLYMLGSLLCNLGLLFTFKYFNFFSDSLGLLCTQFGLPWNAPNLKVLLPVGISFYTFQTLSYTIDIYRGKQDPEKHLGIFALYVAFFPQLVAGPIERSSRLLPQLHGNHDFDYDRAVDGLRLMLWGLFKKVIIADRLALMVDLVYANPGAQPGPVLLLATIFFAFQIYCDFSGYSDIAIGAARLMGIQLMTNFDRPYTARSIADFWRRWHISLSSWFRDYVFIPMGGSRVRVSRMTFNILVVFIISGLWHGANWTFIIWGALHGLYYLLWRYTRDMRARTAQIIALPLPLQPFLHWSVTFTLVCVAWVFFRAESLSQALTIFKRLPMGWSQLWANDGLLQTLSRFDTSPMAWGVNLTALACLLFFEHHQEPGKPSRLLSLSYTPLRWAIYIALILAMFRFGETNELPFIYFQF